MKDFIIKIHEQSNIFKLNFPSIPYFRVLNAVFLPSTSVTVVSIFELSKTGSKRIDYYYYFYHRIFVISSICYINKITQRNYVWVGTDLGLKRIRRKIYGTSEQIVLVVNMHARNLFALIRSLNACCKIFS